jgi:iron complex outermembrane receptor protein
MEGFQPSSYWLAQKSNDTPSPFRQPDQTWLFGVIKTGEVSMTKSFLARSGLLFASVSVASLMAVQPALAQDAAAEDGGVGEIIVTAQKRAENAQNVPISITALDQQLISASGVTGTNDLRAAVPALNVTTAVGGFGLPRIRGIGSTGQGASIENPVALYVDGVYVGASFANLQTLFDAKQVAVLKGPQGTLFGRNATGGLIQITTLGPQQEWTGKAEIGYGNYEAMHGGAYIAGGLGEGVAFSLSGQVDSQTEGFGRNLFLNRDVQTSKSWALRGKLQFDLGADTTALLAAHAMSRDAADPAFTAFGLNTLGQNVPAQITALGGDPRYDILADINPEVATRQHGASLTVDHDFGGVKLRSISGYLRSTLRTLFDPDGTTVQSLVIANNFRATQFTQEINLISDSDGPLSYVLGAFYMWEENGSIDKASRTSGINIFGNNGFSDQYVRTALNSYSGFAELTYALGEATHITAGLRYTKDNREFTGSTVAFNGNTATTTTTLAAPASQSFSKPTWRVSLDHRLSPELMVYASYNRGFRSGGFSTGPVPVQQLQPELVDAYEIGFKSDLFDRRVRINLAGYYFDQSAVQVMQIIAGVQNVYNAKGAKIYGLDGDISVKVTDNLQLFGGFNWNRSRYKAFTDAVISIPFPLAVTNPLFSTTQYSYVDSVTGATVANTVCLGTFVPPNITTQAARDGFYRGRTGGNCLLRGDASGNKLQNTPDLTFNIGAKLDVPTSAGKFTLAGNYYYNGGYVGSPDERVAQASFNTLDASLTWTHPNEHLNVRLWGKNLTNAFYRSQIGASNSGDNGYSGAPRTYGLTLGFEY